ncbi:Copper amine oxidase N-terminal domain-containing protein [Paenibacillaceae bacterium GAS479]|nr:Copper amine oxidase N-terminal domain-containing protein [Paenibacillaceae bacterium GAS479]
MNKRSKWLYRLIPATLAIGLISVQLDFVTSDSKTVHAADGIRLMFNGSEYKPNTAPFVDKGMVYIPLRDVGGLLGSRVKWDQASRTVLMSYPELQVKLSADAKEAVVNDTIIQLSSTLRNVNGALFVPIRFFAEATGTDVQWDPATNTVNMKRLDDYDDELERRGIWLNRVTGELYTYQPSESRAVKVGQLDAAFQGKLEIQYGYSDSNIIFYITDHYGDEANPSFTIYSVLLRKNKIIRQTKASYKKRYEPNVSGYQTYHPDGWKQFSVLTDGKVVTVYNEAGEVETQHDLTKLTGVNDIYSVLGIGSDYLVVRPQSSGMLTLIDLKDDSVVLLADQLLKGKELDYARTNTTPYRGDELNLKGNMGNGILEFYMDSPIDGKKDVYTRFLYERPSYEKERAALPKRRSVSELASICTPETLKEVNMQDGDITYIPLLSVKKEDLGSLNAVCGILKKLAINGVEETFEEDLFPTTFFHGVTVSFKDGDSISLYGASGGIATGVGFGKRLVLRDQESSHVFKQLYVSKPKLSLLPGKATIGDMVRIKGYNDSFWEETSDVFVYWEPLHSTGINTINTSLLIYTGKARFGLFDFNFKLPATGKASNGTMKPLQAGKGMIRVYDSAPFETVAKK